MLDDLGLDAAVDWLAADCAAQSGLQVNVHCGSLPEDMSDAMKTAAYRMVQEALTNVRRHAQAQRVDIYLQCSDEHLMIRVIDDGVGVDVADGKKIGSYGLVGMRERARQLGGNLTISNMLDRGCKVELRIPLRTQNHQLFGGGVSF
jgi:signal transduction histidine kinase